MLKQTTQLAVHTDEEQGMICIEQSDGVNDEPATVIVSPDQVSLLIEWLQQAKAEVDALDRKKLVEKR